MKFYFLYTGVAAAKDHDIGTTNLHIEVSDVVNILVYVGIAKGNGILSKSGKEIYCSLWNKS